MRLPGTPEGGNEAKGGAAAGARPAGNPDRPGAANPPVPPGRGSSSIGMNSDRLAGPVATGKVSTRAMPGLPGSEGKVSFRLTGLLGAEPSDRGGLSTGVGDKGGGAKLPKPPDAERGGGGGAKLPEPPGSGRGGGGAKLPDPPGARGARLSTGAGGAGGGGAPRAEAMGSKGAPAPGNLTGSSTFGLTASRGGGMRPPGRSMGFSPDPPPTGTGNTTGIGGGASLGSTPTGAGDPPAGGNGAGGILPPAGSGAGGASLSLA